MSVWRDMARDAGMEPLDEAAAWIEQRERERYADRCPTCEDDGFVIYGGRELPCPQCRTTEYDAALAANQED